MNVNRKDLAAGALFAAIGSFYFIYAIYTLPVGRAFSMGPGYFPLVLSSITVSVGVIVIVRSFLVGQASPFGATSWRGIAMLTAAIGVFATFLEQLGLFPAVLVTAFLACLSSGQITLSAASLTSLGIATFCTIVFGFGLKLPIPILGSWFGR